MTKFKTWMRALGASLAVLMVLAVATPAEAAKLYLKNGTVYEGRVKREADEFIVFVIKVGDVETSKVIARSDIDKLVQDEAEKQAPKEHAAATPTIAPREDSVEIPDGATKVAFVSLAEMVGPYMNRDALMKSVQMLDELPSKQRPDILVLQINSGGGYLFEMLKLTETIHKEIKPKFRTVAWVESAISAAAMTAFACEEIYMMGEGNIGACTGFSSQGGRTTPVDGTELEEVLMYMEKVSAWGKRDPLVMRAMQISGPRRGNQPLTCDIDADGNVSWYDGPQGEFMVCPGDEILTLTTGDAVKYRVAVAEADDKATLAKAMGLTEWVEVGPEADQYQHEFREVTKKAEARMGELLSKLNIALQFAQSAPTRNELERQVGLARKYLREMRSLARQAPLVFEVQGWDNDRFEEVDEMLRKMLAT